MKNDKMTNTMMNTREILVNGIAEHLRHYASKDELMSAYNRYFDSREIVSMGKLAEVTKSIPLPEVLDWVHNNNFCSMDNFVCVDFENCDIYSSDSLMELVGDAVYDIAMDAVDCCECDIPTEEVEHLGKIAKILFG